MLFPMRLNNLNSSESSKALICRLTALWVTPSCRAALVMLRQFPTTEKALSEVRLGEFLEVMARSLCNVAYMRINPKKLISHYKNE